MKERGNGQTSNHYELRRLLKHAALIATAGAATLSSSLSSHHERKARPAVTPIQTLSSSLLPHFPVVVPVQTVQFSSRDPNRIKLLNQYDFALSVMLPTVHNLIQG